MRIQFTPKINYDRRADVLYVSISDTGNSYGVEDDFGLVFLRDANTDELTGITILGFRKQRNYEAIRRLLLEEDIQITSALERLMIAN